MDDYSARAYIGTIIIFGLFIQVSFISHGSKIHALDSPLVVRALQDNLVAPALPAGNRPAFLWRTFFKTGFDSPVDGGDPLNHGGVGNVFPGPAPHPLHG